MAQKLDFKLPFNDLINYVPKNLRNPVINSMIDNLFNRFMTHDESIPLYGYAGRKPSSQDDKTPRIPQSSVARALTDGQLKKFKDGDYVMWAHAGKKLLKSMPDEDKLAFIDVGAHIANTGEINFKEAWRIDKAKIKDLKKDASNFFEIAEKVK